MSQSIDKFSTQARTSLYSLDAVDCCVVLLVMISVDHVKLVHSQQSPLHVSIELT